MIGTIENKKAQNGNKSKMNKTGQLCILASVLAIIIVASNVGFVWAETGTGNTNTILATDNIKNNPTAMNILQNIELFKQRYAAMQQKQHLIDQQNQFIEQQRKIANQYLQNDLAAINNGNNPNTPRNAFAGFVTHVSNSTQSLFWDQFSFMQQKVQNARDAMNKVLKNGGTIQEALQAYDDAAATHKDQLVSINKDLNVKYHLADKNVQDTFNKDGQLNRNT